MKHLLQLLFICTIIALPGAARAQTLRTTDTVKALQQDTTRRTTPAILPCEEVSLYPNPATTELNIVYGTATGVQSVAIYNLIGKMMNVYRTGESGSANLNIESIPSGIYYVCLMNPKGEVIGTRKFTKQ